MSSDEHFIQYLLEQLQGAGTVTARKMFGEYGVYCDGKMAAVVCDNRFFVRPTAAGRAFIGTPVEEPPYPGSKPNFLIEEQLEDAEWLCQLLRLTVQQLPAPKPKKGK